MQFKDFLRIFQNNIASNIAQERTLFTVDADKDKMWELYLESFAPEDNRVFRKRREHDCSACRHFVKSMGNVVALRGDLTTITLWDLNPDAVGQFAPSVKALRDYIHGCGVSGIFIPEANRFGTPYSMDMWEEGPWKWDHLNCHLPNLQATRSDQRGSLKSKYEADFQVLRRSVMEITKGALDTVIELINDSNLYKGTEWLYLLTAFRTIQEGAAEAALLDMPGGEYLNRYLWCVVASGSPALRLRNHSIGVLLTDISEGMDLNTAVSRYEKMVAPENYRRTKKLHTKAQTKKAEQMAEARGLIPSLPRRFARIDDITVRDILYVNRNAVRVKASGIFEGLAGECVEKAPNFSRVKEIGREEFLSDVLPNAAHVELYLENRMEKNMVSLISPQDRTSPPLTKWANGFTWAYEGNLTDSSMKERVKAAGGRVEGDLRFSIQWNEENDNPNDYDAHCIEPAGGTHIEYPIKGERQRSSGMLDVDIQKPGNRVAVENIIYTDKSQMPHGEYRFFVHNYADRGGENGFRAEVEFGGQIFNFDFRGNLAHGCSVDVAKVHWDGENFMLNKQLPSGSRTREIWSVKSQSFRPVSLVMHSPNHWDGAGAIGHKHLFLMLPGAINPCTPNGFFNEFLPDAFREVRAVFEALGSRMKVAPDENQLSGVGFSTTKPAEFIVRVTGASVRVMKVKW